MADCKDCGASLGRGNKSGYCRLHFSAHKDWSGHGEKISASLKHKYQTDPEYASAVRTRARTTFFLPQSVEARKKSMRERRLWEVGWQHITPEARKRAAEKISDNRLSWCPREFRKDYLRLIYLHWGRERARTEIERRIAERDRARVIPYVAFAADFLAIKDRCPVSRIDHETWRYGTVRKSSEEIIRMAQRKGWQPLDQAA